jgi:hypothetical protein
MGRARAPAISKIAPKKYFPSLSRRRLRRLRAKGPFVRFVV